MALTKVHSTRVIARLLLLCACCAASCSRSPGGAPATNTKASLPPAPGPAELERNWEPLAPKVALPGANLWWEAETPRATNFPPEHPFVPLDDRERSALSAGAWIGVDKPQGTRFLEYELRVEAAASYQFFARKFWKHGAFRWRFDAGPWHECGRDVALLDDVPIRQFVEVNWVALGEVELAPGTHLLRIETTDESASAFDAFVLSRGDFTPRGKLKPGERFGKAPDGWFVFEPPTDPFSAPVLDLRSLNQDVAGSAGPLRARGSELIFEGSAEVVRFWGVSAGIDVLSLPVSAQRRYARRLAGLGVNLLRLHGAIFRDGDFRQVDEGRITAIHRLVDVLRAEGIYLGLSIYFPAWLSLDAKSGFAGYTGQTPFGLSYFSPEFESIEKHWWQRLLGSVNPQSGQALAKDPALAYVELLNEDSALFWTFQPYQTLPEPLTAALERRFGQWLSQKYGNLSAAFERWGGAGVRGDDAGAGRAGFLGLGNFAEATPRAQDTAEFLTRQMRDHYARLAEYLRRDLGYSGLTVCSNWHTANERVLGPLDNWANSTCSVMDRHAYVSGPHEGEAAGFSVRAGQSYVDHSALLAGPSKQPEPPPFLEPRYNGLPSFVSEVGWPWPNRYRTEAPLLVAAYSRLNGIDAPIWFAHSRPDWAQKLSKFELADPTIFGQFPVAAALFRRGLTQEPASVLRASLSEADLFSLRGGPLAATTGLDTFRQIAGMSLRASQDVFARALLVGPVDLGLGGESSALTGDVAAEIQRGGHLVQSRGGELLWDFDTGVLAIRAASIQAAVGFLGRGGELSLPQLLVRISNEYAAVALIALDDRPIETSTRLLLQVVSEATNQGWRATGATPHTIEDPGGPPVLLRRVEGSVVLRRPDAARLCITALDPRGHPTHQFRGASEQVPLLPDTLYYSIVQCGN